MHALTLKGGMSIIYLFIYPAFWVITLVVVAIFCIRNRKRWFQRDMLLSTLIAMFFCTPIVLTCIYYLVRPASYITVTGYNPENGYVRKFEDWNYYSGGRAAKKYWKRPDDGASYADDSGFEKDSTWVFFNKNGDTIKTETYRDDRLVKTKVYK